MSHTVQINYEQIAVQCHSICEVAENQVAELDKMLADLEGSSSRLLNDQTEALRKQIEREKRELIKSIEAVKTQADKKTLTTTAGAQALQRQANKLATGRLAEMRALLDSLLSESIAANQAKMIDRANGVIRLDEATKKFLDTIEDEVLRQFVYIAFVRDSSLSGTALLEAGKALMNESVEARYEKEAELIRAELAAAKVPAEMVDKIVGAGKPSKKGVIITIAREHGSSGKQIGRLVAERLGIPFYYKEMTALAAQESGLDQELISDINVNFPSHLHSLYLSTDVVQQAVQAQDKVIRKIADNGSCVIVGRAADYVLRDYEDVVRIFIYAPEDYKIKRVMEIYGDSAEDAKKNVRKSDEARASYYRNISENTWGDRRNYELMIDSSIGVDASVNTICTYLHSRT